MVLSEYAGRFTRPGYFHNRRPNAARFQDYFRACLLGDSTGASPSTRSLWTDRKDGHSAERVRGGVGSMGAYLR